MAKKSINIDREYKGSEEIAQLKVEIPTLLRERVRSRVKNDPNLGQINLYVESVLRKDLDNWDWREDLKIDIIDTVNSAISDVTNTAEIEDKLSDISKAVEQTADFVEAETMGLDSMIELRKAQIKTDIIYLLSKDRDLPSDSLAKIALVELEATGYVARSDDGAYYLV